MNEGKFRCSSMSIVTPPGAPVEQASICFTSLDGTSQGYNKTVPSNELVNYVGKTFEMVLNEVTP